jgi:hypothetical protein
MARFQSLDELESQFSQLESLMHTVPIYKSACMHDRYSALQKCTDENKDNVKACESQRNSFQQELSKRNTDCAQKLYASFYPLNIYDVLNCKLTISIVLLYIYFRILFFIATSIF